MSYKIRYFNSAVGLITCVIEMVLVLKLGSDFINNKNDQKCSSHMIFYSKQTCNYMQGSYESQGNFTSLFPGSKWKYIFS